MDVVRIYKKQCLQILEYQLYIFPPLIPYNFIIFTYNRVVNLSNYNIIQEVKNVSTNKNVFLEERLNTVLSILDRRSINYTIEEDIFESDTKNKTTIPMKKVKKFMKKHPLWAMNESLVIKLPSYLLGNYNKSDELVDIIQRSIVIREYLEKDVNNSFVQKR